MATKIDFDSIIVGRNLKEAKEKPKVDYDSIIVVPDSAKELFGELDKMEQERAIGLAVEVGEGITLGFLGELAAIAEAATSDASYQEAKDNYEIARKRFKRENPGLAAYAVPLELAATIPTGVGLAKVLGKAGIKSVAGQAGAEGAIYGFATGENFEERAVYAGVGGLAGATLGRIVDAAITPSSAGGLKTADDIAADAATDIDSVAESRLIEQAELRQFFDEVDSPAYREKPLSEAQTVGELWKGVTTSVRRFYNEKLTGVSDNLMREVSPQVGAKYQKSDQRATLTMNKEFGPMAEDLANIVKITNENERAKGALLDYAAGLLEPTKIANRAQARKTAIDELMIELAPVLNNKNRAVLRRYLEYSARKNDELNKKVFNFEYPKASYLHTRLTKELSQQKKNAEKLTDEQLESFYSDPAQQIRSRGSYLKKDTNAPKPSDYINPLVSDIQRIQKLEQLAQLQKEFLVDSTRGGQKGRLTPTEFMNEFESQLFVRGISPEGAKYARQQIADTIMGLEKTPHPLIQALNSLAYATTLAGPMSAILNIADIPLVGAKYGGKAVREGLKEADPRLLTPFKKPSDIDLKEMGLDNQVFGEFVSAVNDFTSNQQSWMTKTAAAMRKGADFMMRKSGFAAMDVVGKKGVMRGVLRSAADDAKAGKLADNWSFYFNDAELDIMSKQLVRHGTDYSKYTGKGRELVEELMFAGLGQQQLISAAGRPAAWARNPNLRPLWALRGFVVKQQALALREVVGNLKAGKPEKAAEFLGRYAAYGAGGYAVINEGRQFIFGDGEMSAGGLARGYGDAWASLLTANTLGLNDYQYGQIKQNGLLYTFAEGMMPIAIDRPIDITSKAIEVIDQERPPQSLFMEIFPAGKQAARLGRNVGEGLGITELEEGSSELLRQNNPEANPN